MKQKYTVMLADIPVSLVSDEDEAAVNELAEIINKRLNEIIWNSRRVSKTEAALFLALDYLAESRGSKKQLDKTEAQLDLYTKNLARMKEENEDLRRRVDKLEQHRI